MDIHIYTPACMHAHKIIDYGNDIHNFLHSNIDVFFSIFIALLANQTPLISVASVISAASILRKTIIIIVITINIKSTANVSKAESTGANS